MLLLKNVYKQLYTNYVGTVSSSARSSKFTKIKETSTETVSSPQVSKENSFYVHLLVEGFYVVFQKYVLVHGFRFGLILNFYLIFDQISGSCSYKIFLISKGI